MHTFLRKAEVAAWILGLLCSATLITNRIEVAAAQRAAAHIHAAPLVRDFTAVKLNVLGAVASDTNYPQNAGSGQILGRLEIPALNLSTPILDDDDLHSLRLGAGHIRGTAMPGGLGNFVVAAHRDTFFRPLSRIKPEMQIRVVTPDETYVYIVDSTKIVTPDQVDVLDMGNVPQMTLITCFPFHYIGAAPKRFTVKAHLLSL